MEHPYKDSIEGLLQGLILSNQTFPGMRGNEDESLRKWCSFHKLLASISWQNNGTDTLSMIELGHVKMWKDLYAIKLIDQWLQMVDVFRGAQAEIDLGYIQELVIAASRVTTEDSSLNQPVADTKSDSEECVSIIDHLFD